MRCEQAAANLFFRHRTVRHEPAGIAQLEHERAVQWWAGVLGDRAVAMSDRGRKHRPPGGSVFEPDLGQS